MGVPAENSRQNYRITLAYDGTNYRGWQRQRNGPTIQQTVEEACRRLFGMPVTLHASGRTDTGVHARGQVAHFFAPPRFRHGIELRNALNAHLPQDIRVCSARPVAQSFHARFSAEGKSYRYQIFCREVEDPLLRTTYWHLRRKLDLEAINHAVQVLTGTHDFAAFSSNPGYDRESTVRTLYRIQACQSGCRVHLTFEGSGFLYRMVRNLTGCLVRIGDGRLSLEDLKQILKNRDRSQAPPPAPARGLILLRVRYPHS